MKENKGISTSSLSDVVSVPFDLAGVSTCIEAIGGADPIGNGAGGLVTAVRGINCCSNSIIDDKEELIPVILLVMSDWPVANASILNSKSLRRILAIGAKGGEARVPCNGLVKGVLGFDMGSY
jgi:hypothetical protein